MEVPLNTVGWKFSKGNRIRVSVANADFPNVWPTPEPAVSHLRTPSRIILPVVPAESGASPPEFVEHTDVGRRLWKRGDLHWEVTEDLLSNSVSVRGGFVSDGAGGDRSCAFTATVARDDPAGASIQGRYSQRFEVGRHRWVEATAESVITSTATDFHVTITVDVKINGQQLHTKRWVESIPRDEL